MGSDQFGLDLVSSLPDPSAALLAELDRLQQDRGRASRAVAVKAMRFRQWVEQVPEARGPLDFGRFVWQRELYEEWSVDDSDAVFLKSNQVGISTLALRWALFWASVHGHTVLFTMPTDRMLTSFSRRRIGPVIRSSPLLLDQIAQRAVSNVGERQIGNGWLICRGTQQPIEEIAGDALIADELDFQDQDNLEASERRIAGPQSAGRRRLLSIPTAPGYGISAAFEATDQRIWTVKCRACNEQNPMRGAEAFAANVDQARLLIVCRKCRKPLDVQGAGEWFATYPDRDVRGYHVPRLIVPGVRLGELIRNSRKTRPDQIEAFYNRDLGEAYVSAENRLGIEEVRMCVDPDLRPLKTLQSDRFVCMGIDVASARALNVLVGEWLDDGRTRRVLVGEVEDRDGRKAIDQLSDLMRAFGVDMAVIDNEPDGRFAREFQQRHPGRVYRGDVFTPHPGARQESAHWKVDDDVGFVTMWRTRWYDVMLGLFRGGKVVLPPLDLLPADYPVHLGHVVRRAEELPNGNFRVTYVKTGSEDYAQAEMYLLAAFELAWRAAGLRQIAEIEATPVPLLGAGGDDWLDLTTYSCEGFS